MYCSKVCWYKTLNERKRVTHRCVSCGVEFRGAAKTCSEDCRRKALNARMKRWKNANPQLRRGQQRRHKARYPEKHKEYRRHRRETHPEIPEQKRNYRVLEYAALQVARDLELIDEPIAQMPVPIQRKAALRVIRTIGLDITIPVVGIQPSARANFNPAQFRAPSPPLLCESCGQPREGKRRKLCDRCQGARKAEREAARDARYKPDADGCLVCSKCCERKPTSAFYPSMLKTGLCCKSCCQVNDAQRYRNLTPEQMEARLARKRAIRRRYRENRAQALGLPAPRRYPRGAT